MKPRPPPSAKLRLSTATWPPPKHLRSPRRKVALTARSSESFRLRGTSHGGVTGSPTWGCVGQGRSPRSRAVLSWASPQTSFRSAIGSRLASSVGRCSGRRSCDVPVHSWGPRVRLLCGRCQGGSAPWPASAGVWGRRAAGDGAPAVRRSSAAPAARGRGRKGWVSHLSPSPVR